MPVYDGVEGRQVGLILKEQAITILERIHEAIIIVDRQGTVLFVNQAYLDLIGASPKKILGRRLTELEPDISRKIFFWEVMEKGKRVRDHYIFLERAGKHIITNITPLQTEKEVIGAVGAFHDVTELQELTCKIISLKKQMEKLTKNQAGENPGVPPAFQGILTCNPELINSLCFAERVSKTDLPVLILGESGTGKELLAQALHENSPRKNKPLITVNCAAIPENLFEAELFGYQGGAFTGARQGGKRGKFEIAHQGTIFLDEIAELPSAIQPKLLRVLENGEIAKLGSEKEEKVDVRIIAATNRDLKEMVEKQKFRDDLYFRLNGAVIELSPLRERKEDIELLTEHFLKKYANGKRLSLSKEVKNFFYAYAWPGNIRELENVIRRVALIAEGSLITLDHLPSSMVSKLHGRKISSEEVKLNPKKICQENERETLVRALIEFNYNKTKAMQALRMSRRTFYKRLKKYNIEL